jgi:hypothetical protein
MALRRNVRQSCAWPELGSNWLAERQISAARERRSHLPFIGRASPTGVSNET